MTACRPRLVLPKREGVILVSSDLHGNFEDYQALRVIFEELRLRDPDALWISVGDWVHGPKPGGRVRSTGEVLYDYEDRSRDLVLALHELETAYAGQFYTLLGNHEHAHIGGRPVGRFRPDEAGFLESQMSEDEVERMRDLFRSWPLVIQVPACGVIFTHGAPSDDLWGPAAIDDVSYEGFCPRDSAEFLEGVLWNYGYPDPDGGRVFLERMGSADTRYGLIIHGHDRHEDGGGKDSDHAYLLCTSFGSHQARKAYLVLDATRTYRNVDDLKEGRDIFRLYPTLGEQTAT
jgi:hypothetical protein